jgi:hypothetical protein
LHYPRRIVQRLLAVVVAFAVIGAVALIWTRVVHTLTTTGEPPQPIGQAKGIVWDGKVFTSTSQFERYLKSRGISYTDWARRHPGLFGSTAATAAPVVTKKHATATKTHKAARTHAPAVPKKHTTVAKTRKATRKHTTVKSTPVTTPKTSTSSEPRALAPTATATSSASWTSTFLTLLVLMGVVVVGGSALIPARMAPAPIHRLYVNPDRRLAALGAATAMLLGLALSRFLN